jgi:hypothetical protein
MKASTFKQLGQYMMAFRNRSISLLIIRSSGGLGKTTEAKNSIPIEDAEGNIIAVFFKGHATPLSIYMTASKHPNALLIFDDVDTLVDNKTTVAILKQLCELREDKDVHYNTTYKAYGEDVPPEFKSNNKVMLLCNDIKKVGANMGALLTRGFYLDFTPSHAEILKKLSEFAEERDIFDHIAKVHEHLDLNFRIYEKCVEIKDSSHYTKLDWKEWLRNEYQLNEDEDLVREIANDKTLNRGERDRLWQERTGKSTRTYYRIHKKLTKDKKL